MRRTAESKDNGAGLSRPRSIAVCEEVGGYFGFAPNFTGMVRVLLFRHTDIFTVSPGECAAITASRV
jgi:hypothetical protein